MADAKYWLGFHLTKGIGPARVERLLAHFGDLGAAWAAQPGELARAGLGEALRESLAATRRAYDLDRELDRLGRAGVTLLTWEDAAYPARLRQIAGAPPVLYVKGALMPEDDLALGVVGTRRATSYGREVTARLAGELAAAGLTIASGLARGVDACAHEAALQAGGRTVAFLGCGVDVVYPADHRRLAERVAAQGALISEYHLGTPPDAPNFPARNRLISGFALGVLVTEAPAKSGALITADFAAEQGRDVFAVPGGILGHSSAGCNALIRDGAKLVTCAEDILVELHLQRRSAQAETRRALPENDDERAMLRLLGDGPAHINDLGHASGLPAAQVGSLLLLMELKGLVRQVAAGQYVRA
ncbi:MAG TPA: DNA-processing protein DprA [Thermomicrobiales bacterium]|nr:DNA-processing protein DprA [Thermomicrobiales bacterium]